LTRLATHQVGDIDGVRRFFDELAGRYGESHGDAARLLRYRLRLIRRLLDRVQRSCLLEIGCGNGLHLFPLANEFDRVIGTDLSPAMIAAAEATRAGHPFGGRVSLHAEAAEHLASVPDSSADAVLCVGAFEHMLDQPAVLNEVARVLKPGGTFVCLTANGGCIWHTRLAPWLGIATRHLSTDRFVSLARWRVLLDEARLSAVRLGAWRFVPAGDMPRWASLTMQILDRVGSILGASGLRGGCYVKAVKPRR